MVSNNTLNRAREIKALKTKHNLLCKEAKSIKSLIAEKQRDLSAKEKSISELVDKIKDLESGQEIIITEHAILRFIERVIGIKLKEIEAQILTPKLFDFVKTLGGSGTFPGDGFKVIMKDYSVVSIVKD